MLKRVVLCGAVRCGVVPCLNKTRQDKTAIEDFILPGEKGKKKKKGAVPRAGEQKTDGKLTWTACPGYVLGPWISTAYIHTVGTVGGAAQQSHAVSCRMQVISNGEC